MAPLFALALLGIRVLPYAIRSAKTGRKIQQIGYKIIVENPKYFNLAKKIWKGKFEVLSAQKGVTEAQMLGRLSTSAQRLETVTAEEITKFVGKNVIKNRNISTIANDAGSKIGQFVIKHPARPVGSLSQTIERGGATLIDDIKLLFGQNIKLSGETLKTIAKAEAGPLALGKDIIKAPIKPTSAWLKTATQKATVRPVEEIAKKVQEFKAAIPRKELIPTRVLPTERPWYVAVIPKFLRPSKLLTRTEFMATKKASTGQPLTETLYKTVEKLKYPKTTGAVAAATTAAPFIAPAFMPGEKPEGEPVKNLDFEALFGGTTGPLKYKQLKIPGSVGIHDVD
jgi:hypothetical protein|tara:strand:+ start:152 stop:1171 length:1020 start_codon:yes stop_codon:yes gene_type:complete